MAHALAQGIDLASRVPELHATVRRELLSRGFRAAPQPTESEGAFRDRLDTALMALFRDSGRTEVFETLYRHAGGRVLDWLQWLVRQRRASSDPVDLLQDTFVNVFRYAHSFRDESRGSFRRWVRTIAANVLRRAQTRSPLHSMQDLPSGLQEPADSESGPCALVEADEERESLRESWVLFLHHYAAAYEQLSPRDRRALQLVEVEGLSYAETGAELGVGPSNMKMIMLRARRRLQKHMRRSLFGDGVTSLPGPTVARSRGLRAVG